MDSEIKEKLIEFAEEQREEARKRNCEEKWPQEKDWIFGAIMFAWKNDMITMDEETELVDKYVYEKQQEEQDE